MKYKLLGQSGLRVSELCLGTMTFGEDWGYGANPAECEKMFQRFLDAGGNFIDTANRYTEGSSEKLLGGFIKDSGRRDDLVVATKYSLITRQGDGINTSGNHRKNMMRSVESSLKRLKLGYIDLLYLHAWDFTTYMEEILRALDDLVRAGKILYTGISDTPAWIVSRANAIADAKNQTPFTALQIEYSLIERTVERELLPMANALGLGVVTWAPLGGGALSGKYLPEASSKKTRAAKKTGGEKQKQPANYRETRLQPNSQRLSERNTAIAAELAKVAREAECSPAQAAIAWVRAQGTQIFPIIGARNSAQLDENLGSLSVQLGDHLLDRLHEASKIEAGFPHEMLQRESIHQIQFGKGKDELIFDSQRY